MDLNEGSIDWVAIIHIDRNPASLDAGGGPQQLLQCAPHFCHHLVLLTKATAAASASASEPAASIFPPSRSPGPLAVHRKRVGMPASGGTTRSEVSDIYIRGSVPGRQCEVRLTLLHLRTPWTVVRVRDPHLIRISPSSIPTCELQGWVHAEGMVQGLPHWLLSHTYFH